MLIFINTYPCSESDREFITRVYLNFERLMFATAKRYIADISVCEDIIQDSIVNLIKKTHLLRSMERCILGGYIVSTVRNTAINHLKHQGLEKKHYGGGVDSIDEDMTSLTTDEIVALTEQKEQIQKIWDRLTEEERLLLEGKYILGLTDQELGHQIGCKSESIRMKLTRTRRKAFKMMVELEGVSHD